MGFLFDKNLASKIFRMWEVVVVADVAIAVL